MEWFNVFGLICMVIIMVPNIIFAAKYKDAFENAWDNKKVEMLEQIGRYGCFAFMIFNIPRFTSDEAFALYLIVDGVLLFSYCLIWIICFKKNTMFRALALSIIPSVIFIFSGIISRSILLTIMAVVFSPCHIMISYKNAVMTKNNI